MSRVGFGWHAIVGAFAFLLACVSGYPARAELSVTELKVRYVMTCEAVRALEIVRVEKLRNLRDALQAQRALSVAAWQSGESLENFLGNRNIFPDLAQVEFESAELALRQYRILCIERKREYLQSLAWQILLAAQTEPPAETAVVTPPPAVEQTTRPPARPPKPPKPPRHTHTNTNRRPPSSYQSDAAAAAAIMSIIGGVIATSRPPRGPTVQPGGQRYQGAIP